MKKHLNSRSAFFNPRVLISFVLFAGGVVLALFAFGISSSSLAVGKGDQHARSEVTVGVSYHHDVSPALRDVPQGWPLKFEREHEANANPLIANDHRDSPDTVVQSREISARTLLAPTIPGPILNFKGIPYPGVGCNCAPPDTNGAVGTTQYVQMVNTGYQVFNKANGNSILGPNSITSLWAGFGGVCETDGFGDPVVVHDQIANRWVITEFAGSGFPTDYCVAVSTSGDATGSYNRYAFHLSSTRLIDYPKIGVWPDAYYVSVNIFNPFTGAYMGPQPFAFDRAKMLAGQPATFVSPVGPLGSNVPPFLPADLDGNTLPTAGAPNTYVGWPSAGAYKVYHFHVDFAAPGNSTFAVFANPPAAPFTQLCPGTRNCVPQLGASNSNKIDAIADRLMHRLAYRKIGSRESLVGNYTVKSNNVAAVRWFELRNVTAGPVRVFQESTYQPDSTWRFMGSAAMDKNGNIAVGFSASSSSIFPQLRYAGRLRKDPRNTLAQGEAHLFDGTGAQVNTLNRWGDYSALTLDPVDDLTFWYTNEYYDTTSDFNWRTRIGSFKLQ